MLRYILVPLALLLLLAVAGALLLPALVDANKLIARAADELHKQTGATLAVEGESRLTLLPAVGIALHDAALTLPGAAQPDIRVRALRVGVHLLPLLSRKIVVDSIALEGVVLRIDTTQQPTQHAPRVDQVAAGAGTALAIPAALNIRALQIADARLEVVDGEATTVVELARLRAKDLNLEQRPIAVELQLRRPGERPVELTVQGTVRLDPSAQQISVTELAAELKGATRDPVALRVNGSIDLAREAGEFDIELKGATQGTGNLRYANQASPRLEAKIHINQFDPALLALAGPGALDAAAQQPAGTGRDEALPLAVLRLIDTHAIVDIDQARFGAHPVHGLHLEFSGAGGAIDVRAVRGELHGGALEATATVDARTATATITTSGKLADVDIAAVLAATGSKPTLSGRATLDWQLQGGGATRNELLTALHGPLTLRTSAVVLQGSSIEHLLCQAVALANRESLSARFGPDTRFQSLAADVQLGNGAATLSTLRAALPGITFDGSGRYDLLSKQFAVGLKARLSPALEELDHACRVSKRLLAIDWPVDCAGNLDTDAAQWCKVDAAQILQDLAGNEGREKLEKKAGKLLDKLDKWLNRD